MYALGSFKANKSIPIERGLQKSPPTSAFIIKWQTGIRYRGKGKALTPWVETNLEKYSEIFQLRWGSKNMGSNPK